MIRLWNRLPEVLKAVLVGEVVSSVGGLAGLLIFVNLRLFPRIPWVLPAAAVWLWIFWKYLNGAWWPRSTSETRRRDLRAAPLPREVWMWALAAGSLGLAAVLGIAFLTPRLAEIPRNAFKLPIDFSAYPPWTVAAILIVISVVAGVSEEAGYRGYMLSRIQRRHGWLTAALVTGLVFFLDHHLSHAYATYAFLPFFLAVSGVHAFLVFLTRSILPSVVLHAAFDVVVIPVQYGLVGTIPASSILRTGMDSSFLLELALTLILGAASVPAFRKLAAVSRPLRTG